MCFFYCFSTGMRLVCFQSARKVGRHCGLLKRMSTSLRGRVREVRSISRKPQKYPSLRGYRVSGTRFLVFQVISDLSDQWPIWEPISEKLRVTNSHWHSPIHPPFNLPPSPQALHFIAWSNCHNGHPMTSTRFCFQPPSQKSLVTGKATTNDIHQNVHENEVFESNLHLGYLKQKVTALPPHVVFTPHVRLLAWA